MAKTPPLKKPQFGGGKRKQLNRNAPKKIMEQWGPVTKKASGTEELNVAGNREFGFIQDTPAKATGAMMGRPPPKVGKSAKRPQGRKATQQFKPRGAKVF